MAKETALELFLGEDRNFEYAILNKAETAAIDIAGWVFSWMLKRRLEDPDSKALVTKTSGAGQIVISGTFNADPVLNTQIVTVSVLDTDTNAIVEGLAHHELKRMDAGLETPASFGPMKLKRGVHRA